MPLIELNVHYRVQPTTGPYFEPDESSPHPHTRFPSDPFYEKKTTIQNLQVFAMFTQCVVKLLHKDPPRTARVCCTVNFNLSVVTVCA
jgi:hypothetical protein